MKTPFLIRLTAWAVAILLGVSGCAKPGIEEPAPDPEDGPVAEGAEGQDDSARPEDDSARPDGDPESEEEEEEEVEPSRADRPAVDPGLAMRVGLMPVSPTGAGQFIVQNPTYDGRGVVIGILDSGLDAGLPGFKQTSTGKPKILDLRDFSQEGRISLEEVTPLPDGSVDVQGHRLVGFGYVAGLASPPYYGGLFHELPLGEMSGSSEVRFDGDVNGNDSNTDVFPVLVVKTASGWAVMTDTDNDSRLGDETPIHDYAVAGETFTYAPKDGDHNKGPMTIAVNLAVVGEQPVLDLFFDNSNHGSHVGGIAAGHDMFGIEGFDGVAPGAQVLSLKISNNARGGISVTGSMLRAMAYAVDYAGQRGLPLVLNLSFGVGNESEGRAVIDSIVSQFALQHPDIPFVISAGNDGPGLSTLGFPGSADHIISACALYPGVFSGPRPAGFATDADIVAWFSSRGGELGKPDLCAPGLAFSNVPRWSLGEEIAGGTSMAAPQLAGVVALLQSAMAQNSRTPRAADIKQALIATALPVRGATAIDVGSGIPRVGAAYDWLMAGHQAGTYIVRAMPDGGNSSTMDAAYRRFGFASAADTVQRFVVTSVAGQPAARFTLKSDQPWLRAPKSLELAGNPATVTVSYAANRLRTPGLYVASVWATPTSDTLSGPAFRLTNTIVVPYRLDEPFVEGRDLGPGRIRRYFFEVPEDAGGLAVELELRYPTQRGSLYLFEPNGQPFRDASSKDVGGSDSTKATILVRGEDLVAGVYEAVVVAPPASALSFDLRAAIPRYAVDAIGTGPSSVIRNIGSEMDSAQIEGEVIGAFRTVEVSGHSAMQEFISVTIPEWTDELIVDVELPEGAWNQYTDFGVTVFDSAGAQVGQGPLNYRIGRQEVEIRRRHRGQTFTIELYPAFALPDPPESWNADVRVSLIARKPTALALVGADSTNTVVIEAGETTALQFTAPAADLGIPEGFSPLIEVTATPGVVYRQLETFSNPVAATPAVRRSRSSSRR
jgi:subtilisin family serine protease